MKKTINILLILFLAFLLSSCFGSNNDDQINQAKKELWVIEWDNDSWSNIWLPDEVQTDSDSLAENESEKQVEKIVINPISDEQFLELDDLSSVDLSKAEIEISGKTLTHVDKIIITYENTESTFPIDVYTLQQFSAWSKTFLYRAFSKYKTFDYGRNVYTIEAYSGDQVSKMELVINYPKQEEKDLEQKVEQVSVQISKDILPTWWAYGNPIELWNAKITYSDLKWLEIENYTFSELTCENLSATISEKLDWWFYWNTCRPIATDKWLSFFVVRLDWDKYYYEKHYYISEKWIYWVQELESWVWVTRETLWDKNTELKVKNSEYPILKASDDLFNEIVK